MGMLQEIFIRSNSRDIICSANYNNMMLREKWNKQTNASYAAKSGPVTTIAVGQAEIDRVLDELGVIRRASGSVQNSRGCNRNMLSSNNGEMDKKVKKVQPTKLTVERLRELIDQGVNYQKIIEIHNIRNERCFKYQIKALGYRLLREELWLIKDKLWLNDSKSHKKRMSN